MQSLVAVNLLLKGTAREQTTSRMPFCGSLDIRHAVANRQRQRTALAVLALAGEHPASTVDDIEVIRDAYRPTVDEERTILVGVPLHGRETRIATLPLHFGKVIKGSHGGESRPERYPALPSALEGRKIAARVAYHGPLLARGNQ